MKEDLKNLGLELNKIDSEISKVIRFFQNKKKLFLFTVVVNFYSPPPLELKT